LQKKIKKLQKPNQKKVGGTNGPPYSSNRRTTHDFSDEVTLSAGRRHAPRAALCTGRHSEGRKYGIMKFSRFWRIGVCIADSDLHPLIPLTLSQFWDHAP